MLRDKGHSKCIRQVELSCFNQIEGRDRVKIETIASPPWRQTIRQRDGRAKRTPQSAAFVPAVIRESVPSESRLVIELSCGRALRVPASISAPPGFTSFSLLFIL
jgi:hypothetical protein